MTYRASNSHQVHSLTEMMNPDDVMVRTKTITTNLQPTSPKTITTTNIKRTSQMEQIQQQQGIFGLNPSQLPGRSTQPGEYISTTKVMTNNPISVAYTSRQNIVTTTPPIISSPEFANPTLRPITSNLIHQTAVMNTFGIDSMAVPDSQRILMTNRTSRIPIPPSATFYPEGAPYPLQQYCCLYSCCPFEMCKCVQCSNVCIRCCGATCFSTSAVGPPVPNKCCNCCTPKLFQTHSTPIGVGVGPNQFQMRQPYLGGMQTRNQYYPPSTNLCNCCTRCFSRGSKQNFIGGQLAPGFNPQFTAGNNMISPTQNIPPYSLGMGTPLGPPVVPGMTTTSLGAGLSQGMGIGVPTPGGMMGMNGFGIGQQPYYGHQGRGIFGNCCSDGANDWCGSNLGCGQNCCSSCPMLRRCCC